VGGAEGREFEKGRRGKDCLARMVFGLGAGVWGIAGATASKGCNSDGAFGFGKLVELRTTKVGEQSLALGLHKVFCLSAAATGGKVEIVCSEHRRIAHSNWQISRTRTRGDFVTATYATYYV